MLYIEDDEVDRRAFLRMVREQGLPYELTTVGTLSEARTRLAESRFDIIIADYYLPDGRGTDLFEQAPETPLILLTGTLEEDLALRMLERRADDYLAKDPHQRHLDAMPSAVEKTLYRQRLRGVEERLTRELREKDRRMRLAQEASGVGTFEWDIPNNRVTWSPELERLYGLPPGGFGGSYEAWLARLHPEDRPEAERQQQRALTTGHMKGDWRVVWSDGTVHWLSGRATVEMDAAGRPLRMLGVNIDVTDRKRAEDLLRNQAALLDLAHDAILVLDNRDQITFWSRGAHQTYGWTSEEALGQVARLLLKTRFPKPLDELKAEVAEKGQWEGELAHNRKDGQEIVVASRWAVQRDQSGRQVGILEINRDITDSKRAEEALRRSEALYRTMAGSIPDGAMSVVDRDLRYLVVEGELLPRLGLSKETIKGRAVQEVFPGEIGRNRAEHFRRALAGESTSYETEYHGRNIWSQFVPLRDEKGQVLAAMSLGFDITERKRTEHELAALRDRLAADLDGMNRLHELSIRLVSQDNLETLLHAILDAAIAIAGADKGHIQLLDPASGELGVTAQRGFDPAFVEFFSHIRPGVVACGTAMQTRQCVLVEDVTQSPLFLAEPRALELVLAAGMRAVACTPLLTRAGQLVGVLSILFRAPHRPGDRDLRLLDLLARQASDFIERRQAEQALRAVKEELACANQNLERKVQERTAELREAVAEMEQISYSMIHDLRAPLRAIQSFAGILEQDPENRLSEQGRDLLAKIRIATNRMDRLVVDVLNYSRIVRGQLPLGPVDAGALARGIVETYPNLGPSRAGVRVAPDMPPVLANEAALTQCLSQLLANAVRFARPGVPPQIRIYAQSVPGHLQSHQPPEPQHATRMDPESFQGTQHEPPPSSPVPNPERFRGSHPSPSAWIRIIVEDNGIGIPAELHAKIFEIFQRLSTQGEGTGMGLALVKKAAERMGGRVGVESEPGRGSRFWLELPAAEP